MRRGQYMNWPLPCFNINSEAGKTWLEEFLGPNSKSVDIGDGIKINSSYVIFDDIAYLTYGDSDSHGPAHKTSNGKN